MRTMRKFIFVFVAFCATASLSVYAGAKAEATTVTGGVENVDPTGAQVVFWYQHSRERDTAMKALIDEFNTTNEWKITVSGEYAGGYNDIYNKMVTAIAGGTMPEIVVAYQNQAATYALNDGLVDLDPYVKSPKWGYPKAELDMFFQGFIEQDISAQFDGMRLGWPPNRSLEVLYYNADWLSSIGVSAPPADWDQFFEACRKATDQATGRYGYAITTDASNIFTMAISRGGNITKQGGGYDLANSAVKDSMEFMKRLYDAGFAKKVAEQYGDQTDFGNAKVLFNMNSTSGLPYYERAIKEGGKFAWNVAAIPHTTPKPVLNIYGASVSVSKSTPEKQLASWLFLKWMSAPEQQAAWVRASNYFPVRKDVADDLGDYFQANPKFKTAFGLLTDSDTRAEPAYAGYDEVRDAMTAAFNAILDGADIPKTLGDLDAEANKIYKEMTP